MRSRLQTVSVRVAGHAFGMIRLVLRPLWRRFRPAVFAWLDAGLVDVRTSLRTEGIDARSRLSEPPYATPWLTSLVAARLAMQRATCLERSLIMQRWMMAIGRPHDVLIGVKSPRETTIAHAWLDHEDSRGHHILMRLPPDSAPRSG
jgi:Transglutaminase-like superfamily